MINMKIPLSRPDITLKEKEAVIEVLNTPNLSLGPKIPEFERIVAEFVDVKYAVAMSSGTSVLHTIIRSLQIGKGDYVLTTPFSFISTSNCLLYEGAEPIFVDIDEETYNLDPEKVEETYLSLHPNIRRKVRAVIYVDVFGVPADGYRFEELGEKYNIKIIEDSAEALGSTFKNRKCGSFGDAGLFAFYPNKQITTGEGGILVTNDKNLANLARSLRNQGRENESGWLQHTRLGYNYRMSDINAALGIAQIYRINEIVEKRRRVKQTYEKYFQEFFNKGIIICQKELKDSITSTFVYVLRLSDEFDKILRDKLLKYLNKNGIQCSNYFTPIHLQPFYQNLGWRYGDFPITEKVSERTIALPFFSNLKEDKISYIYDMIKNWFEEKR